MKTFAEKYTLTKKLSNNMSRGRKVDLMTDNETNELVVIKIYSKERATLKNIQRELDKWDNISSNINSNFLLKLDSIMEDDSFLYLISDYCSNGDLIKYITKNFLTLTDSIKIQLITNIAKGIEVLHKNNICHLDIKLDNILITESGDIKICDFEFSEVVDPITCKVSNMCGTPYYVPPEIANISTVSYNGKKADIWSYGVIVYSLFAESFPFDGISRQIIIHKIKNVEPKYTNKIPNSIWKLISDGLLQKKAENRWSIEKILEYLLSHSMN